MSSAIDKLLSNLFVKAHFDISSKGDQHFECKHCNKDVRHSRNVANLKSHFKKCPKKDSHLSNQPNGKTPKEKALEKVLINNPQLFNDNDFKELCCLFRLQQPGLEQIFQNRINEIKFFLNPTNVNIVLVPFEVNSRFYIRVDCSFIDNFFKFNCINLGSFKTVGSSSSDESLNKLVEILKEFDLLDRLSSVQLMTKQLKSSFATKFKQHPQFQHAIREISVPFLIQLDFEIQRILNQNVISLTNKIFSTLKAFLSRSKNSVYQAQSIKLTKRLTDFVPMLRFIINHHVDLLNGAPSFQETELTTIQSLCQVLSPLELLYNEFDKNAFNSSKILFFLNQTTRHLNEINFLPDPVSKISGSIKSTLKELYDEHLARKSVVWSTFLDPRANNNLINAQLDSIKVDFDKFKVITEEDTQCTSTFDDASSSEFNRFKTVSRSSYGFDLFSFWRHNLDFKSLREIFKDNCAPVESIQSLNLSEFSADEDEATMFKKIFLKLNKGNV